MKVINREYVNPTTSQEVKEFVSSHLLKGQNIPLLDSEQFVKALKNPESEPFKLLVKHLNDVRDVVDKSIEQKNKKAPNDCFMKEEIPTVAEKIINDLITGERGLIEKIITIENQLMNIGIKGGACAMSIRLPIENLLQAWQLQSPERFPEVYAPLMSQIEYLMKATSKIAEKIADGEPFSISIFNGSIGISVPEAAARRLSFQTGQRGIPVEHEQKGFVRGFSQALKYGAAADCKKGDSIITLVPGNCMISDECGIKKKSSPINDNIRFANGTVNPISFIINSVGGEGKNISHVFLPLAEQMGQYYNNTGVNTIACHMNPRDFNILVDSIHQSLDQKGSIIAIIRDRQFFEIQQAAAPNVAAPVTPVVAQQQASQVAWRTRVSVDEEVSEVSIGM